jgi:acetylornithine deacetylase/succinyl-diaminopimelate desuccinylase-like protein
MADPILAPGLESLDRAVDAIVADAIDICEVPAPTFHEQARARHVAQRMTALGLGEPHVDELGDVFCEVPGRADRPTVVAMAHLDTVFGPDVSTKVRRDGHWLHAPGIGDNSIAVASLLHLGRILQALPNRGTLLLAANVGEEGLGNLRGAKAVWERYGARADAWIVLEGASFNRGVRVGVCSRRLSIVYRGDGGHSWHDFGKPSATHAMGRLIAKIADLRVSADPRTTYNVGTITGGTTVNTIAAEASILLDMRSEDVGPLGALHAAVRGLAASTANETGVRATVEVVGDREGGRLVAEHPLVVFIDETSRSLGTPIVWEAGSTDTNVPLSHGAAAVCLGLAKGERLHTVDEALDIRPLPIGLRQTYVILAALLRGEVPLSA